MLLIEKMVYLVYVIHVSKTQEELLRGLTLEEKYACLEAERNSLKTENELQKKSNLWKGG